MGIGAITATALTDRSDCPGDPEEATVSAAISRELLRANQSMARFLQHLLGGCGQRREAVPEDV
jgi:hypothetical protein